MSFEFILSHRWSLGSCCSLHWMNGISLDPLHSFHDDDGVNNFLGILEIGSQVGCS